jgi:hypothetical protein
MSDVRLSNRLRSYIRPVCGNRHMVYLPALDAIEHWLTVGDPPTPGRRRTASWNSSRSNSRGCRRRDAVAAVQVWLSARLVLR